MNISQQPIGIFDSGIGGLTVAKAIHKLLPNEAFIYVADMQHLPYGDKTVEQIQTYSVAITQWLIKQNCKMIVIACNTASSSAADLIRDQVAEKIPVIDVVEPVVQVIAKHYHGKTLGLIATQRTVESAIYVNKLKQLTIDIQLNCLATPLLAPYIEKSFPDDMADCQTVLAESLHSPLLKNISTLILACTHYPLIKTQIENFYQHKIKIIDSPAIVAKAVEKALTEHHLLATKNNKPPVMKFYCTQASAHFQHIVELLFGAKADYLSL